jgi:hypothetical protein
MAQIPKICKKNGEKTPKRPEFPAFGDAVAHSWLRHPTAAPAARRYPPKAAKPSPNAGMAIRQMPRPILTKVPIADGWIFREQWVGGRRQPSSGRGR